MKIHHDLFDENFIQKPPATTDHNSTTPNGKIRSSCRQTAPSTSRPTPEDLCILPPVAAVAHLPYRDFRERRSIFQNTCPTTRTKNTAMTNDCDRSKRKEPRRRKIERPRCAPSAEAIVPGPPQIGWLKIARELCDLFMIAGDG